MHSPEFKARVALEALKGIEPMHVLASKYQVHPVQVTEWKKELLAGLPEAFALVKSKYGANYPSLISFITGPSRTGDIERILVLGAHGPKKLTVIIIEE